MLNRRTFIASSSGLYVFNASPNSTIRLGVIGAGGRGTFVMAAFGRNPNVEVAAICDVYEPNLERGISTASADGRRKPRAYRSYPDLLNDKDLDAVLIATPEHWHHKMVLDALASGKDIYVEKPLCHTPEQGSELVAAEQASKQIVQCGMQRRSYDLFLRAKKLMEEGSEIGKVRMVRSWWLNNYLGAEKVTKLDGKLDWDQWQGPAPKRPFDPDRFHNWRFYSDYAGGIVADQGAHVFDGIHMLMGSGTPVSVSASAGKPHRPEFDTPESVTVAARYPEDYIAVFTINYAAMKYKPQRDQLNQFDGDTARLDVGREDLAVYPQGSEQPSITYKSTNGFSYATDLHVANFLECMHSRKKTTAPIALGFQSTLVVQMANLSLQHGRQIRWNAASRKVEV
jgi:predicted dehydrogenase